MDTYHHFILLLIICITYIHGQNRDHNRYESETTWTAWSNWSPCSGVCDVGVKSHYRECVGMEYGQVVRIRKRVDQCPGQPKEYYLCNAQPCSPDSPTPKESQCSAKNDQQVMGQVYEWDPFYGGNPCELTCMARGYSFLYNFGHVADGTFCHHGNNESMCVEGTCMKIGCDGRVGSGSIVDKCGVCGGKDDNCMKYTHTYSSIKPPNDEFGYVEIAQIPAGVTHLRVTEQSGNYLAIADVRGTYIINGNWMIDWPGKFEVAGTTLFYEKTRDKEIIRADGPTKEELHLYLLFREVNPGVHYEFWIPIDKLTEFQKVQDRRREAELAELALKNSGFFIPEENLSPYSSNVQNDLTKQLQDQPPSGILADSSIVFWVADDKRNDVTNITNTSNLKELIAARSKTESLPVRKDPLNKDKENNSDKYADRRRTYGKSKSKEHDSTTPSQVSSESSKKKKKHRTRNRKPKLKIPDGCDKCKTVRANTENFCSSDFVVRVHVRSSVLVSNSSRYEMQLVTKYKESGISLFSQEYMWVSDRCHCPHFKTDRDYIVMGHLVANDSNRESRLEISSTNFVRPFGQKQERRMFSLKKKSKC